MRQTLWLRGGADFAGQLMGELNELVLKHYPVVVGSGIPFFKAPCVPKVLTLTGSRVFNTGATITTYTKQNRT
ncbi:hypothetical protein [Streptomyces sp. NPDC002952]|uniref:hypothetical protein n=1 Tax=Streptomyces sp. NPDC002952 TaxID=3364673 RepID=UPI00367ADE6F